MHRVVSMMEIINLLQVRGDFLTGCCTWRTEGVMLFEVVTIEEMNFSYWGFSDLVQNVRSRSTCADNADLQAFQAIRYCNDLRTYRRSICVAEDRFWVSRLDDPPRVSRNVWINDTRLAFDKCHIVRDLLEMIRVASVHVLLRLVRELEFCWAAVHRRSRLLGGTSYQFCQRCSICTAREATGPPHLMIICDGIRSQDAVPVLHVFANHRCTCNVALDCDVWNRMHQQMLLAHLYLQPEVFQLLKTRIRSDWFYGHGNPPHLQHLRIDLERRYRSGRSA